MTTWLTELARLAQDAMHPNSKHPQGWEVIEDFHAACTPERIAALVRVAQAAGDDVKLIAALRDLEATP